MSEQPQDNDSLPPESDEKDMVVLIKKVQQRLVSLEKKIDILISQSEKRPASEKHFSKPFRPFGRQQGRPERGPARPSGERKYSSGRPSERRYGEESRDSGYKKRSYGNSRESGPGQEGNFKKRYGGAKKGLGKKTKPFYAKVRVRE